MSADGLCLLAPRLGGPVPSPHPPLLNAARGRSPLGPALAPPPAPRPPAALVRVRVLETYLKSLVFWFSLLIEGRGLINPDPLEAATPSPPSPRGPIPARRTVGQCLEGLLPLSPAGQGERSTGGASGGVGGRRSPQSFFPALTVECFPLVLMLSSSCG